ncbi:MAG: CHASE domain-containing protein [Gammaproteobacteria bacterium]|nr:CHASE domain-containing protein [Gammaproteobacteria bacterium]
MLKKMLLRGIWKIASWVEVYGLVIFSAIVLLFVGVYIDRSNIKSHQIDLRNDVQQELNLTRIKLEDRVLNSTMLYYGLQSVFSLEPDMSQARFLELVKPIVDGADQIKNIAVAPRDLVVRYVYPLKGNEKVIGIDYNNLPEQLPAIQQARQTGKMVLSGPLKLVQGGEGFIARLPIFSNVDGEKQFRGIISSVIPVSKMLEGIGYYDKNSDIEIAIRGKDALGANGELFMGSMDTFENRPELQTVILPNGSWKIAATPKGGWNIDSSKLLGSRIFIFGVALLIWVLISIVWVLSVRKHALDVRLRAFYELSSVGISLTELDTGKVIEMNKAVENVTGYSRDDFHSITFRDIAVTSKDDDEKRIKKIQKEGRVGPYERVFRRKDGSKVYVLMSSVLVHDISGKELIWSVAEDISDRKKMEEELVEARREAERANQAKSIFLSTMSHELRTPLTAVLGFGELLSIDETLTRDQHENVQSITDAGEHLLQLINEILELSKIEAGKLELNLEAVNGHYVIQECIDLMRSVLTKYQVTVEYFNDRDFDLFADVVRLKQVLINLISNSIKYNKPGGKVSIYIENPDNRETAIILVCDTGLGIPDDKGQELFEPFSRINPENSDVQGTGIGLSLTRKIVESMNGSVSYDSVLGIGTCFCIELPVHE